MLDDRQNMALSAYTDAELHAPDARQLERELSANPSLREEVHVYKRLDESVARMPVPDASSRAQQLWHKSTEADAAFDRLVAEVCVPPEPNAQTVAAIWRNISARTVAPSTADCEGMHRSAQFDREIPSDKLGPGPAEMRLWNMLDQLAAELPVPPMRELAARELSHNTAARLDAVHVSRKLEAITRTLPVPTLSPERDAAHTQAVSQRIRAAEILKRESELAAAPAVKDARWGNVWDKVASRTGVSRATRVDLTQRARWQTRWPWLVGAVLAAAAIIMVAILPLHGQGEAQVAMEIPDAVDPRYGVQVQYLNDQDAPVVCFFLKNDERKEPAANWRWLPD